MNLSMAYLTVAFRKLHLNKNPVYFTHVKKGLYTMYVLNALWILNISLLLILR